MVHRVRYKEIIDAFYFLKNKIKCINDSLTVQRQSSLNFKMSRRWRCDEDVGEERLSLALLWTHM